MRGKLKVANVIGVRVDSIDYQTATKQILNWAGACESRYVCVATVHTVMEARDSAKFFEVINRADLVTPDGMPLVWMLRLKGRRHQRRVYGPTLMLHLLEQAASKGVLVGFYGTTQNVMDALIDRIQVQYPALKVIYAFSPPFRDVSSDEDEKVCEEITSSGARIIFVGLGCPKQEWWIASHRGRIPAVMIGVGAALDFHSGTKAQAPKWIQNIGFEWMFRLLTEPRRLWRRYLYHNPRFIILAIADLLGFVK